MTQMERYRLKQQRAIEMLGGCCVDCGATEELAFDHFSYEGDGRAISQLLPYRWEVIETELKFCELRCIYCHARRHNPISLV